MKERALSGRELDVMVARTVPGLNVRWVNCCCIGSGKSSQAIHNSFEEAFAVCPPEFTPVPTVRFSEDDSATLGLLCKARGDGEFRIRSYGRALEKGEEYDCHLFSKGFERLDGMGSGATIREAICRAAINKFSRLAFQK